MFGSLTKVIWVFFLRGHALFCLCIIGFACFIDGYFCGGLGRGKQLVPFFTWFLFSVLDAIFFYVLLNWPVVWGDIFGIWKLLCDLSEHPFFIPAKQKIVAPTNHIRIFLSTWGKSERTMGFVSLVPIETYFLYILVAYETEIVWVRESTNLRDSTKIRFWCVLRDLLYL